MHRELFAIGCDEAGRGAWAGPIVAAAVMAKEGEIDPIICDSKLIKEAAREKIATLIIKNYTYGVGVVSSQMIDAFGITYANSLAFERALRHLRLKSLIPPNTPIRIDGRKLPVNPVWQTNLSFHEKGESKFRTIAAASIVAKTYRDSLLKERGLKEPQWGWENHKGYGTASHTNTLKKHFPIQGFHRFSYKPIQSIVEYHTTKTG
jgi:ribonuclease HII